MTYNFDFQKELNQKLPDKEVLSKVKCINILDSHEHRKLKGFELINDYHYNIPPEITKSFETSG